MPQLRWEVGNFVEQWNNHRIRKKPNQKHVHSGIPAEMYFSPAEDVAVDCGIPLPQDRWEALRRLADIDGIDLDKFLPSEIHTLCTSIMERYSGPDGFDTEAPFLSRYIFLRDELVFHQNEESEPRLSLLESSTGGWTEFRRKMRSEGVDIEAELARLEVRESDEGEGGDNILDEILEEEEEEVVDEAEGFDRD